MQRDVLPIPDRPHEGLITYDAKDPDTSFPPIEPLRPPAGAPNVLDRPARRRGLRRLERVRRAVLDAHRRAARRERAEVQPLPHDRAVLADAPGAADRAATTTRSAWAGSPRSPPRRRATTRSARTPRRRWPRRSSSTATRPRSSASATRCRSGRRARWGRSTPGPAGGGGFEHFYGFIGGETNQYAPALYDGTVPVEPDRTPEEGYHLTEDMTDRAIDWVRQQKALMPDKPFFAYFAPGRHARAAPRAARVVGQVQGPLRRRAGTRCARRPSRARRSSA